MRRKEASGLRTAPIVIRCIFISGHQHKHRFMRLSLLQLDSWISASSMRELNNMQMNTVKMFSRTTQPMFWSVQCYAFKHKQLL